MARLKAYENGRTSGRGKKEENLPSPVAPSRRSVGRGRRGWESETVREAGLVRPGREREREDTSKERAQGGVTSQCNAQETFEEAKTRGLRILYLSSFVITDRRGHRSGRFLTGDAS